MRDTGGPWIGEDGHRKRRQDHPDHPNIDHIVPLEVDRGLAFELDNLQLLHRSCHMSAKQRRDRRGRRGGKKMQRDDDW